MKLEDLKNLIGCINDVVSSPINFQFEGQCVDAQLISVLDSKSVIKDSFILYKGNKITENINYKHGNCCNNCPTCPEEVGCSYGVKIEIVREEETGQNNFIFNLIENRYELIIDELVESYIIYNSTTLKWELWAFDIDNYFIIATTENNSLFSNWEIIFTSTGISRVETISCLQNICPPTPPLSSGVFIPYCECDEEVSFQPFDTGWRFQNSLYYQQSQPINPAQIIQLAPATTPNFWYRLKDNVSFNGVSNNLRFVSIRGNQDFTDGGNNEDVLIFDKYTGQAFIRVNKAGKYGAESSFTDSRLFDIHLSNARSVSFVCGGYTFNDFFVPSKTEINNSFGGLKYDSVVSEMIKDPISGVELFNANMIRATLWTSSTDNSIGNQAVIMNTSRKSMGLRGYLSITSTLYSTRQHFRTLIDL